MIYVPTCESMNKLKHELKMHRSNILLYATGKKNALFLSNLI